MKNKIALVVLIIFTITISVLGISLFAMSQSTTSSLPSSTNPENWQIYFQDPTKTPGDIMEIDIKTLCTTGYTNDVRLQTTKIKKTIFKEYGINWRDHSMYEDDHLIPLVLGGSNEIINRFPQFYCPKETAGKTCAGAREKDVVENYFHKYVCDKNISEGEAKNRLKFAQEQIVKNWFAVYRKIKGF